MGFPVPEQDPLDLNPLGLPPTLGAPDDELDDDLDAPDESLPLPDPFEHIDEAVILQCVGNAYQRSRDARWPRKLLNDRNWAAFNRDYDFLKRKTAQQSKVVLPALEMSLEQICGQMTKQLTSFRNWFSIEFEGGDPLPGLTGEVARKLLRGELERLYVEGNALPTTYGTGRLVYDALKLACIESEVTMKVTGIDQENLVFRLQRNDMPNGDDGTEHGIESHRGYGDIVEQVVVKEWRLKVELVPFADFYPDPSPSRSYCIHEVEVAIADLPGFGFDEDDIAALRGHTSTEKEEDRRKRSGAPTANATANDRVLLREFWGNLIHPQNGTLLAKNVLVFATGNRVLKQNGRRVQPNPMMHGRRPFVNVPLVPTPTSPIHHAFLDIARPLVEVESELTNLVIDGGVAAIHGIKEVREYMLEDPNQLANGLVPGIELTVREGQPDTPVVRRVDSGTLPQETLTVLDRISRERQEAFATNDLQLGRLPARKESATALTQLEESADSLFSQMALLFEDGGIEPMIELAWLTMWQFLDEFGAEGRLAGVLGPELSAVLELMAPHERFVALANGVRIKVQGYKYQLAAVKEYQKLLTLQNSIAQSPELLAIYREEFSPRRQFELLYRAIGVDPEDLRYSAEEKAAMLAQQQQQAMLAAQQAAMGGGVVPPGGGPSPMQQAAAGGVPPSGNPAPNPTGERGIQYP